uniref:Lipocalin 3 n=1 Tax=Lonomia obliqua TaxID=304329 RepID=Q5MGD0_LONON|nr:lipocalin 3 [Lonomia obliqua]
MLFILTIFAVLSAGTAFFNQNTEPIVLSPEVTAFLKGVIEECIEETGVVPNILELLKADNYVADDKNKSFLACGYRKAGALDSEGKLHPHKIASYFPDELNVLEYFQKCNKHEDEVKETAYQSYECTKVTLPYHILI